MRNGLRRRIVKNMLRTTLTCAVATAAGTQTPVVAAEPSLNLTTKGKSAYIIALPADSIPAEKTAAEQLQKYLQEVTGAELPIRAEGLIPETAPQILVGQGKRARRLLPGTNWDALGKDGIVIQTVGKNLVLAGERPRGALYAVYQFLEDTVGCRWWTPTESAISRITSLSIKPQNLSYAPPFSYREHYTNSVKNDPVFATMLRQNGHHQKQTPEWGGHYNMLGFVHTFSQTELLPLEKYFKDHPEWYSDPANGYKPATKDSLMPEPQGTDPCYSSPGVLEEVTKNALKWIDANPDAGYISISQNDSTGGYCRDEAAVALIEKEGSPSAPLLQFVNAVAAKIHEKYPGFLVETLAYNYSELPPKTIKPASNVIVRLAPISSDFGHPFDSDWNKVTRDKVLNWSKISPQLFIWNYVTNFYGNALPHPNWDGLAADLRFLADHKVTGIFEQGDAYTNGVGDFVQLRAWLIGKLMWNPNLDQDKLIDEFMTGYYGAAAPSLRKYLDGVLQAYREQKRPLPTFNQDLSFFDVDVMNRSQQLFDEAETAVQQDVTLLKRVQRERLSLQLARRFRFKALQEEATRDGKTLQGDPDPRRAMEQFIADARSFGVQNLREGTATLESEIPRLLAMFEPEVELPQFFKALPRRDVIDIQPGAFTLFSKETLTFLTQDKETAGGQSADLVGDTNEWGIQLQLGQFLSAPQSENFRVYALVRATLKPGVPIEGDAIATGHYDNAGRITTTYRNVALTELAGPGYHRVDLGVYKLSPSMFIWFASARNPAVERLHFERVILVREKAEANAAP
jgi:hypothetical protein